MIDGSILWQLCEEISQELGPFQRIFRVIDEYYMPTRYPDAVPGKGSVSPSIENAREALEAAEEVYSLIRSKVGTAEQGYGTLLSIHITHKTQTALPMITRLKNRIASRNFTVGAIGLRYVGLPVRHSRPTPATPCLECLPFPS